MNNLLNKYKAQFEDIKVLFDYQTTVIDYLLLKKNTLSIIPTGGGKSLIYQLMALELQGITLVVSPLLALMEEQVNELNNKRKIKALALNSNIPFVDQREILRNLKNKSYKLIYISPERLQNPFFRASIIASKVSIDMLVVDEAHCISQWGSSFRPEYGQISKFVGFIKDYGQNPFLYCLTATLSKKARKDIVKEFKIDKKQIFLSKNLIRDNLKLNFEEVKKEKDKEGFLRAFLKTNKPSKSIVYLYSKRECENYANIFKDRFLTDFFHAGRDTIDKENVYQNFLNDKIELLFATTAFGMGINIPNIDSVIHLHIPNSIEEYYQQVGRGWREKVNLKDCNCLALWSHVNFDRRQKELERTRYTNEILKNAFRILIGSSSIKYIGQVVNKEKDSLINSRFNLLLLSYKLEKYKIIKNVGEINGTPLSIELKSSTEFWNNIVQEAKSGMDSFNFVCKSLNISINDVISHLYDQEFQNNISKLPALSKDVYFELLVAELNDDICSSIVDEINTEIDYKISQLNELKVLFSSDNHEDKLNEVLL